MKKLSQKLVKLLSKKKLKVSFAESCTGGLLSSAITSIKCSKELQKEAIKINKNLTKQNIVNFQIRIAIATGYAKVGNLGPNEKVDYTIIGSVVNLSSRLDALGNSGDIIIDDKTHFFSKDDYDIESLGKNKIKGFNEAIEVYKVN